MPWFKTSDGSIEDADGKVIFFSKERFVEDICLGNCCFICGAKPGTKDFNDEHVIPEWVLRRYNLFDRTITLPNSTQIKYARYKVPCCVDCNSLMGKQIEERISKVVCSGAEAVQNHIANGHGLELFVWLGLIFLKTHLKDREYRVHLDRREEDTKISDVYEWETLHHLHCVVRCFANGAKLEKEVIGSMGAFAATSPVGGEVFDFGDIYAAQTMLIRLDSVAVVATFNDASGSLHGAMPRLKRISGPLSHIQAREVMVDFAFMNLSIAERPIFYSECDTLAEIITEKARMPDCFELVNPLDLELRGKLFRGALGGMLGQMRAEGRSSEQIEEHISNGTLTLLFDDQGNFISENMGPLPMESTPRKDTK